MSYSAFQLRKSKYTFSGCKVTNNILFSNEKEKNKIVYSRKKARKADYYDFLTIQEGYASPLKPLNGGIKVFPSGPP